MLIQVNSLDNGSGLNSNLDIYIAYNTQQKLFEQRPYCRIDESDLCDLLTDNQIKQLERGIYNFTGIKKSDLEERANKIY